MKNKPKASDIEFIEMHGYRVRTMDGFMRGAVDFPLPKEDADKLREALRSRAEKFEGSHVVYDTQDDEDGWLIVGTEKEVIEETLIMIAKG